MGEKKPFQKEKIKRVGIVVAIMVFCFLLGLLVGSIGMKIASGNPNGLAVNSTATEGVEESSTGAEVTMELEPESETEPESEMEPKDTALSGELESESEPKDTEVSGDSESGAESKDTEVSGDSESGAESKDTKENGSSGSETGSKDTASEETKVDGGSESGTASNSTGKDSFASPSRTGALKVTGNQLTDASGNPVQLRGVSTHGLAWYPDYVNESAFKQFRQEWGANVVRLALYTEESGGYCNGGNKDELKKIVKNGVEYATKQDMYVIIDWHILSDGNPNTNKEEAKKFFKEMASTYASYNNVIYEICNEPNGGTSWADIKSYASEVISVIREKDSDAVILVGTPNWSQYVDQAAKDPITDSKNIMYTLHFYAGTHKTDLQNKLTTAHEAGLPIFVSEFGICDASGSGGIDETSANKWISILDSYGISYVAWNLSNKGETSAIFKSSCSKKSGFTESDLSDSGRWGYETLVSHAKGKTSTGNSSGGSGSGSGSSESAGNSSGGNSSSGSSGNSSEGNSSSGSSGNSSSGGSAGSGSGGAELVLTEKELKVEKQVVNSWESEGRTFYQYVLTLNNPTGSSSTGWKVKIDIGKSFTFSDGWNGQYKVNGNYLEISSMDYNGTIASGSSTENIGFIISVP